MGCRFLKKLGIYILTCLILFSVAGNADEAALPIDFSGGMTPLEEGYIGALEYKDESIHVRIDEKRIFNTDVWIAYIKIAHPSQLRTLSARGFDSAQVAKGEVLSRRSNAVLTINGDYYSYENTGYLIRQSALYRNLPGGVRDVLLIDKQGDFHFVLAATEDALSQFDTSNIVNTFNFGPALVMEGQRVESFIDNRNAAFKPRQRMCIAQTGPLEYMCIATGASGRGSTGMTLEQLSIVAYDHGAIQAYNLDGGDSTMMFFQHKKVNDPNSNSTREISDIVYFASTQGQTPDK